MSTQLKAAKLVSALLGEQGPDDYLNQLGIVRQSQTSQPKPEVKPIDIKPGSLASNILKGNALEDESDMDADDLVELWADKRLRRRGLRADRESVEALLNDLGSSVDEYIEYNEGIYSCLIDQITEEIEHSKKDPDGWWALLKSVVDDEDADDVGD